MNSSPPTTLTPYNSKTVKDRENLLTYYWKLSLRGIKCKRPHQNRMKNKNFTSPAKSQFFTPWTHLYQNWKKLPKNACSILFCIFYKESFGKNPIEIGSKIKFFHNIPNWITPPPTTLTPFSSKTVRDRENLLAYYWKLSLRGIKCKKPHQNRMKNKNFSSPAKSHFFNPLTPFIQKSEKATKKCFK